MQFLEIFGATSAILVLSQILFPLLMPNYFRFFWLFRKEKVKEQGEDTDGDLEGQVKKAVDLKKSADKNLKEVSKETEKNLKKAQDLHSKVQ
jgi:hypothetical protein